jgi:hypothetical protein
MGNGAMALGPQATAPILDSTTTGMTTEIKPFHPAPERMRSSMIRAFVRKTMSQKIVVTP